MQATSLKYIISLLFCFVVYSSHSQVEHHISKSERSYKKFQKEVEKKDYVVANYYQKKYQIHKALVRHYKNKTSDSITIYEDSLRAFIRGRHHDFRLRKAKLKFDPNFFAVLSPFAVSEHAYYQTDNFQTQENTQKIVANGLVYQFKCGLIFRSKKLYKKWQHNFVINYGSIHFFLPFGKDINERLNIILSGPGIGYNISKVLDYGNKKIEATFTTSPLGGFVTYNAGGPLKFNLDTEVRFVFKDLFFSLGYEYNKLIPIDRYERNYNSNTIYFGLGYEFKRKKD